MINGISLFLEPDIELKKKKKTMCKRLIVAVKKQQGIRKNFITLSVREVFFIKSKTLYTKEMSYFSIS